MKKIIISIVLAIVICAGGYFLFYFLMNGVEEFQLPFTDSEQNEKVEKIEEVYFSKLNGAEVLEPETEIWAVMIENSPESRPVQKGLSEAEIVFEAIAEGGITRYLALFSGDFPEKMGPVRSARPYFIEWAEGFRPFYFHAGGSDEALRMINSNGNLLGFDALVYEGKSYFVRDKSIAAPHNLFAISSDLLKIKEKAKWSFDWDLNFWKIPGELPAIEGESAENFTVDFSFPIFKVEFTYDAQQKNYLRKVAGKIHDDKLNGAEVRPSNVIVMKTSLVATFDEKEHMDYTTVGTGKAWFFRNGKMFEGSWSRVKGEMIQFFDKEGALFAFEPGQIFIEVIDLDSRIEVLEQKSVK